MMALEGQDRLLALFHASRVEDARTREKAGLALLPPASTAGLSYQAFLDEVWAGLQCPLGGDLGDYQREFHARKEGE